jgi:PAS domain S-box-containing protein
MTNFQFQDAQQDAQPETANGNLPRVMIGNLAPPPGAADALSESNARFAILTDAMPQMVWSTLPDGFHDYYNARWYEFTGVPLGSTDGEAWNGMFHPDDQDRAWARWRHSLETGEPYEIEYRLRHRSGEYRWTLGRALPVRDAEGRITRWIGTCTDIDEQKRQVEHNEILSRELSHRIKNIFAVISGLIGLSARRDPSVKTFADDLRARVSSLGRAHEFVRPHSEESQPMLGEVTLKTMLHDLLSAYPAHGEGRLQIAGDDVTLDDRGATPVALVFHELATNAAKYGALSVAEGQVAIDIANDGTAVTIRWSESNGPKVVGPPDRQGFGTRLTDMSVVQQLGGTLERAWLADGLRVDIKVKLERLVRT